MPPLPALTLWQPWAWCIAHGTKRVENRNWPPPDALVGQRLAIHAGRHYDADGAATLPARAALGLRPGEPPGPDTIVRGAIVAVATVAGAVLVDPDGRGGFVARRVLGPLAPDRVRAVERDPWTEGAWGWVLEDVVAVEPIACPGNRRLWAVEPTLAEAVLARRR